MKHLIPMADFVLEQDEKESLGGTYDRIVRYAKFLKRPLKLGMFIPCDEEENILEEPLQYKSYMNLDEDMDEMLPLEVLHNCKKYQEAKERVLFDGFKLQGNKLISKIGEIDLNLMDKLKIEDITGSAKLTESALKQIGL